MIDIEKLKPIGKRMIIEVSSQNGSTSSGLLVAETQSNMAPVMGLVKKAGDQSEFKVGQTVMFRRFAVDELKFANTDTSQTTLNMIEDSEVLAVLE
jgi:co-chaperonin GroES (HSP10)